MFENCLFHDHGSSIIFKPFMSNSKVYEQNSQQLRQEPCALWLVWLERMSMKEVFIVESVFVPLGESAENENTKQAETYREKVSNWEVIFLNIIYVWVNVQGKPKRQGLN